MNITCDKELLERYITAAERVTSKHSSLPVLNAILITTNKKTLIIRATNLEVGVEFQIPAIVDQEGSIAIPGSLFANTLAGIPDEKTITLQINENICKVITKTKNLTIKGLPSDDFPTIPVIQDGEKFTLEPNKFIHGVKTVIQSAAISDVKPELSSIYITHTGDSLVFVATDSFRLAEKKIKYQQDNLEQSVIFPVKNITEFSRIIESVGEGEDGVFMVSKTQISFIGSSVYLTSRVIQGVYPDYQQIIPKTHTTNITILKQDLINTLKLSQLFSDKFNKVSFIIDPQKKLCTISTKNTDIGEVESQITATLAGEPIEIVLNGKHVFDALSSIEKDSIDIQFNGAGKPAVIRGSGDQSFTYLTMPITR